MPNYRRAFVPGGCWFFTVNLLDRRQTLLVDQIEALRGAVAACATGHTHRFIGTFAQEYFHLIGQVTAKQAEISANGGDRGRSGGLRFANPPYELEPREWKPEPRVAVRPHH